LQQFEILWPSHSVIFITFRVEFCIIDFFALILDKLGGTSEIKIKNLVLDFVFRSVCTNFAKLKRIKMFNPALRLAGSINLKNRKTMKRIVFKQLLVLLAIALLGAVNVDAKKKKTNTTIPAGLTGQARELYTKAVKGDEKAQMLLAYSYQEGENAPKDQQKAIYWYTKAAEKGNVIAQYNLGDIYDSGNGVNQDFVKAAYWFRKAADQGDAMAQCSLGNCYFNGDGMQVDYNQAAYWFRKAAMQGNAVGQRCLGICYDEGKGLPQDYELAIEWYEKAAAQGDAVAQFNLGRSYANGEGVKKDLKKAAEWFKKAAATDPNVLTDLRNAAQNGDKDAKKILKEMEK